jgi:adenylate cyclase
MPRCTLRVAISTLVSGLILGSAVSIVASLYYGTKKALVQTTYEMMGQITSATGDKVTERLGRVEHLNRLIADLIRSGTIRPTDGERFMGFLRDMLVAHPAVTIIDCALPDGDQYQAFRMADGSISRHRIQRTAREVISTWEHQNPAYAGTFKDWRKPLAEGYDPRTQAWYKTGIETGKPAWADIYSTKGGLNYPNVNPVYGPDGKLAGVVNLDMRLEDLSLFLHKLEAGKPGLPFIIDKDFHVIALPLTPEEALAKIVKTTTTGGRTEFALRDIEEIADGNIRHAVLRFRNAPDMHGRGFLGFLDPAGRRMLAAFETEPKSQFTFGVVVAEAEILGTIKRDLDWTLALAGAFFLLSLVVAYRISRSISRPLATLAGQVDRIRCLDFTDAPPVRTMISEVVLIGESVQNMRMGLRSFKKYVPAEVVTRLMNLQKEAVIEGEKRELTIFFSDIADFTSISEQLSPEALVERLGTYFEEVTRILIQGSGTVDKFIGDAIMGFWGAPTALADHAVLACRSALQAQDSIRRLNQRWLEQGGQPFHTRMGIHTGEAIVGNVGFEGRMNYTAIGDSVNLASRLEGLNKHYGTRILVSETTLEAAGAAVLTRVVDLVTVKGKEHPIAIHELLAMGEDATEDLRARARACDEAFGLYRARRWGEALKILEGRAGEPDGPVAVLMERCRQYLAEPPGPEWDGVYRHHEK